MSLKFKDYATFDRPKELGKNKRLGLSSDCASLGIPPLLCQGDSGGHNLFFRKAVDGTLCNEVCAFLDWQIAFKGSKVVRLYALELLWPV